MVELHGWLTISETCRDEDLLSQAEFDDIKQKVNEIITNCDSDIELQYMNGTSFIRTLLCSNHHTKQVDCNRRFDRLISFIYRMPIHMYKPYHTDTAFSYSDR